MARKYSGMLKAQATLICVLYQTTLTSVRKQAKIQEMKDAGTLLFLGNSQPGNNQLGDGVYLAEKLGDYGSNDKVYVLPIYSSPTWP
jgi:hypothetical protein